MSETGGRDFASRMLAIRCDALHEQEDGDQRAAKMLRL